MRRRFLRLRCRLAARLVRLAFRVAGIEATAIVVHLGDRAGPVELRPDRGARAGDR